jgi:hypothetical protein
MKKIISITSIFLMVSILCSGIFSREANAQNVGSLKSVVTSSFSFNKDLQLGDIDRDVRELQRVLNADPATVVAIDDEGGKDRENNTFGTLTKEAVIKFQNKYSDTILAPAGLTVGNGFVGKLTRTRLNLLIGVLNTSDSVGSPESRVGSGVVSAPVITTSSTSQMSVCRFVDLLLSIGVVSADKADLARSSLNCPGGITVCQFVNLLVSIGAIPSNRVEQARSATNCSTADVNNANDYGNYSSGSYNSSGSYVNNNSSSSSNSSSGSYNSSGSYINNNSSSNYISSTSTNIQTNLNNTSPLNVTCTATPYVVDVGTPTVWTAVVAGGSSNYRYSWSGDDNLASTKRSFSKTYSSSGYKYAAVKVTSGSVTRTANCRVFVGPLSTNSSSNQDSGISISMDGSSVSYGGSSDNQSIFTDNSSFFVGTPFSGQVTSVLRCILSYNPYIEDTSIRQVVINPCPGSTGQSTGYLIVPTVQVPFVGQIIPEFKIPLVGQTVLGRYITTPPPNCLNRPYPPGDNFLGRPSDMRIGDSCQPAVFPQVNIYLDNNFIPI